METLYINQFVNKTKAGRYYIFTQILKQGKQFKTFEKTYNSELGESEAVVQSFTEVLSDLQGPVYIELFGDGKRVIPVKNLKLVMLSNLLQFNRPNYIMGKYIALDFPDKNYKVKEKDVKDRYLKLRERFQRLLPKTDQREAS